MTKNLVIVESPAKARTIERYLGPDFKVLASYGHVRDLPENPGKGKFGVDVEHDFTPEYVVNEDRRKQLNAITKAAGSSDLVYLATDLDREGEAIAWHVVEAVKIPSDKTRRVTFSEITKSAITDAFADPRDIDMGLVDAQQTRRIMDRLVGYTLSPLISRKVRSGLSAGRVQSVAVRLVVERERAIEAFTPREYWTLEALLETPSAERYRAALVSVDGTRIAQGGEVKKNEIPIPDEATAQAYVTALQAESATVTTVKTRSTKRNPAPPFTTSTMQQEASRKLSYGPRRTMSVAQRLYEGIEIDGEPTGLITYMRTDSVNLAKSAQLEAYDVINGRYGREYSVEGGRGYKTRAKGAQEAHEAIRPTSFGRDPESLRGRIKDDELRLYRLIWQRALASQMAPKQMETTTAELEAGRFGLRASATRTTFDGFTVVYTEGRDDNGEEEKEATLPSLAEGDRSEVVDVEGEQHFTEPPPRYTEASLIKALEEHGIGRPSTYAATISTIQDRGYVKVVDKRLRPEIVANIVTDVLVEHFGDYVDYDFTARMEQELDEVAEGKRAWVPLLHEFYDPLKVLVDEKRKTLKRAELTTEETDEVCSEGHPMVIRLGRNGRFLACSMYPDHKETRDIPGEEPDLPPVEGAGEACPECGQGTLVARRGRYGPFAGCDRYPDCKYIHRTGPPPPPPLPFEVECPKCGEGTLVARRARRTGNVFYGCGRYPKCDFTTNFEPLGATHDADAGPVALKDESGICLRCGASVDLPGERTELPGKQLPGGPPDPAALQPSRARRANSKGRKSSGTKKRKTTKSSTTADDGD
ncbi:MAG: type I DNA topoisomerase [Candidatus Limnocylindrales bacterium]